jgi:hypothetical protein
VKQEQSQKEEPVQEKHRAPLSERVLSCSAAALRGKKSKIEEVFCGFACYTSSGAQLDALCDQTTNAPELRHKRSKGVFLHE